MAIKMILKYFILVFGTLCLLSGLVHADARLEKKLSMEIDQAKQTQETQKKYRKKFSTKRQQLHRKSRKLRSARKNNNSIVIAQQEQVTAQLQRELEQICLNENSEIRSILTLDQFEKFEEFIQQRRDGVGSSRDVKDYQCSGVGVQTATQIRDSVSIKVC